LRAALEAELDAPLTDDQIILSRRLARSGRSKAYVNDAPVSVDLLRRLGEVLVDIHGQHESHSLLQPAYQLQLLDAFGRLDEPRAAYLKLAERMRELRRRHQSLSEKRQMRQRELSLLRFEREELDEADLRPGEVAELTAEKNKLVNAVALREFTDGSVGRLYDDDGSVYDQLGRVAKEAGNWASLDPKVAEVASRLAELLPEVEDLAETLRDLSDSFDLDPERVDEVEARLSELKRLEGKYHRKVEDLIAYRTTLEAREAALQKEEDDLSEIEAEMVTAFGKLKSAAATLGKARQKVAKKLAAEVQKHFADLGMPNARLDARLEPVPLGDDPLTADVPAHGADALDLMLAANPGEPPRPLRKVASGGELSRTMLALKSVLARHAPVGTLVFDEIDSDVGGRLGGVLGQKLSDLGKTHQVISVTHLPQVASYAGHQWTIRKQTKGQRTSTTIRPLGDEAERIDELASMLRGESRGETTRQEVVRMLEDARKRS
jgi:DNA repair protein RecN (Recombination protein N)